jgi:molybdopterin-guanine dinucleotide biosynthesis protein A
MQRDKAALEYAGQPQLARALALLEPLVTNTFISVRADQLQDPQRISHPCIVDQLSEAGPIGGILAALRAQPTAAWLVLACDLPFLDSATLQQLIAARDPGRLATAFRSSHDDKPEPLCAIYEPACLSAIEAWVASGQHCPRGFLAQADVALLRLRTPRALDNINTASEYDAAHRLLGGGGHDSGTSREVQVQYFAVLREQAGRSDESVSTRARDARELYEELRKARGLKLRAEQLRVAINEEFAEWSQSLADGDRVVFLPPVAGG